MSYIPFCLLVCQSSFIMIAHSTLFLSISQAHLISVVDGVVEFVRVRHASSAAVKSGKALPAAFLRVHAAPSELFRNLRFRDPLIYISHEELFLPYKLMAWIQVSPGSHSKILGP